MRADTKLYISGQLIDLNENTALTSTYQAADIMDLSSRRANYTNRLSIPATDNNCRAFGYANNVHSSTVNPYRKLPARIVQNGIETMPNGTAVIVSISNGYFDVDLYSGIYNFFDAVGDKLVNDLNTLHIDTYPSAPDQRLIQPFIDYGSAAIYAIETPIIYSGKEYYSIPYSTVVEEIINQAGYEFEGPVFDHPKYKAMHIAALGYGGYNQGFIRPKEFEATLTPQTIVNGPVPKKIPFANTVYNGGFWNDLDTYTVVNDTYSGPYFTTDVFCKLKIVLVDMDIIDLTLYTPDGVHEYIGVGSGTYEFEISKNNEFVDVPAEVSCQDGTEIYITMGGPYLGTNVQFLEGRIYNKVRSTITGEYVSVQGILPDVSQREIMKDFAVRFGLLFSETANVLKCVHIKDIISNRISAIDWSSKRDRYIKDSIGFDFKDYAKTNYFAYEQKDEGIELLGRGSIDIDNENLEVARDLYTSPFVNTDTVVVGKAGNSITTARIDATEVVKTEKYHDLQDCRFYFYHQQYSTVYQLEGTYDVPQGWKQDSGIFAPGNAVVAVYYTLVPGDRVLVVGRGAENGVYVVDDGPWTRATDADSAEDLVNARVKINEGVYAGVVLIQTSTKIDLGVTPIEWRWAKSGAEWNSNISLSSISEINEPGLRLILVRDSFSSEPDPLGAPGGIVDPYKVGYFMDYSSELNYSIVDGILVSTGVMSLHWQTFIDEFYSELSRALQKAKLVTRYYRLTERDINTLDFQKLIYDDGDYFLLNRVVNYIPAQTTQVELFKL